MDKPGTAVPSVTSSAAPTTASRALSYTPPAAAASERQLRSVARLVSSPQAATAVRLLGFVDRVFGGLLTVAGDEASAAAAAAARPATPMSWVFPRPWYEQRQAQVGAGAGEGWAAQAAAQQVVQAARSSVVARPAVVAPVTVEVPSLSERGAGIATPVVAAPPEAAPAADAAAQRGAVQAAQAQAAQVQAAQAQAAHIQAEQVQAAQVQAAQAQAAQIQAAQVQAAQVQAAQAAHIQAEQVQAAQVQAEQVQAAQAAQSQAEQAAQVQAAQSQAAQVQATQAAQVQAAQVQAAQVAQVQATQAAQAQVQATQAAQAQAAQAVQVQAAQAQAAQVQAAQAQATQAQQVQAAPATQQAMSRSDAPAAPASSAAGSPVATTAIPQVAAPTPPAETAPRTLTRPLPQAGEELGVAEGASGAMPSAHRPTVGSADARLPLAGEGRLEGLGASPSLQAPIAQSTVAAASAAAPTEAPAVQGQVAASAAAHAAAVQGQQQSPAIAQESSPQEQAGWSEPPASLAQMVEALASAPQAEVRVRDLLGSVPLPVAARPARAGSALARAFSHLRFSDDLQRAAASIEGPASRSFEQPMLPMLTPDAPAAPAQLQQRGPATEDAASACQAPPLVQLQQAAAATPAGSAPPMVVTAPAQQPAQQAPLAVERIAAAPPVQASAQPAPQLAAASPRGETPASSPPQQPAEIRAERVAPAPESVPATAPALRPESAAAVAAVQPAQGSSVPALVSATGDQTTFSAAPQTGVQPLVLASAAAGPTGAALQTGVQPLVLASAAAGPTGAAPPAASSMPAMAQPPAAAAAAQPLSVSAAAQQPAGPAAAPLATPLGARPQLAVSLSGEPSAPARAVPAPRAAVQAGLGLPVVGVDVTLQGAGPQPVLGSVVQAADRFLRRLAGWHAARDAQVLPVQSQRMFQSSLPVVSPAQQDLPADRQTRSAAVVDRPVQRRAASQQPAPVSAPPPVTEVRRAPLAQAAPAQIMVSAPAAAAVTAATGETAAPAGSRPAAAVTPPPAAGAQQAAPTMAAAPAVQLAAAVAAPSSQQTSTIEQTVARAGTIHAGQAAPVAGIAVQTAAGLPLTQAPAGSVASAPLAPLAAALAAPAGPAAPAAPAPSRGPGRIGALAEQFSSSVGLRAAGLTAEYIDASTLVALSSGRLTPAQASMLAGGSARSEQILLPLIARLVYGVPLPDSSDQGLSTWRMADWGTLLTGADPLSADAAAAPGIGATARPLAASAMGWAPSADRPLGAAPGSPAAAFASGIAPAALAPAALAQAGTFPGGIGASGADLPGLAPGAPASVMLGASPGAPVQRALARTWPGAPLQQSGEGATALPWPLLRIFPAAGGPQAQTTAGISSVAQQQAAVREAGAGRVGYWSALFSRGLAAGPEALAAPGAGPLTAAGLPARRDGRFALPSYSFVGPAAFAGAPWSGAAGGIASVAGPAAAWAQAAGAPAAPGAAPAAASATQWLAGFPQWSGLDIPAVLSQAGFWEDAAAARLSPLLAQLTAAGATSGTTSGPGLAEMLMPLLMLQGASPQQDVAQGAAPSAQAVSRGWPMLRLPPFSAAGWQPPATVRAALSGSAGGDTAMPLWSGMAPVDLAVVSAAVNEQLPQQAQRSSPAASGRAPSLTVIQGGRGEPAAGGGSFGGSSGPAALSRSAPDITLLTAAAAVQGGPSQAAAATRLVEAARTTAARPVASDDRVTLGDLTLISMATQHHQIAAATSGNAQAPASGSGAHSSVASAESPGKSGGPQLTPQLIEHIAKQIFREFENMFNKAKERRGEQ